MTTWQRGDLAMCVNADGWVGDASGYKSGGPAFGEIRVVEGTRVGSLGAVGLYLDGYNELMPSGFRKNYAACYFRKIRLSAIGHVEQLKAMTGKIADLHDVVTDAMVYLSARPQA